MAEGAVVNEILVAVTKLPGGMFWRNNTGALRDARGRWVQFGLVGSGDILGCYRKRAVSIEAKTATMKQSQAQIRFQSAWEKAGGVYILARSAEDALKGLQDV